MEDAEIRREALARAVDLGKQLAMDSDAVLVLAGTFYKFLTGKSH